MGQMLTKYLMRNQPYDKLMDTGKESKINVNSDNSIDTLSRSDLESQQRMLDNMRNNVLKNTDLKMNDVKTAVYNVHETLRNFTKESNSKLQTFDSKINNLHTDC